MDMSDLSGGLNGNPPAECGPGDDYLADDLQGRQYPMAGVLRQLAREVAMMEDGADIDGGVCRCGEPIVQPRTGRPRKFCLSCSPRKSRGKGETVRVVFDGALLTC